MNDVTPMPQPAPNGQGKQPDPPERLRQLWQQGHRPAVREFLTPLGPLPPAVLATVLRVDQRHRWQSGERVPAETYLSQYPAVAADADSALDLIYSEYLLRERSGESVVLAEFLARFPEHAAALRVQVELHKAIALCGRTEVIDPLDDGARPEGAPTPDPVFPQVPGYEVLAEVGRGGMGVIYKARQVGLNRVVALKMIAAPALAGPTELARFRTEAEAVACLQHPNVVQIYEVGHREGLSYLALEFMDRGSLAARLAGKPLSPRHAAELIETLARAVGAAHDRGIVHRDLKPANVLLATPPAVPEGGTVFGLLGVPKITDFGLAKSLVEVGSQTLSGTILGTPSYMAPEQAEGKTRLVGPSADVYALGAILYECLTGRPPFVGVTLLETLGMVRSQEPVSPRRLRPGLPRDLVTVCLKALAKEPRRRYPTALALAEDLRAFREGRPVKARPVGPGERVWRWCRRNPAVAALSAGLAALAVALLVGLPVAAVFRSERDGALANLDRAEKAEAEARALENEVAIRAHLARATAYRRSRQEGQRFKALEEVRAAVRLGPSPELLDELRNEACAALALADLCPGEPGLPYPADGYAYDFDEALSVYARTDREGNCSVRRVADDAELHSFPGWGKPARPRFSADGRFLAVVPARERMRLWDLGTTPPTRVLEERDVFHVDFHRDGRSVAVAYEGGAIGLFDLEGGQLPRRFPPNTVKREPYVALHPTEPLLAVASYHTDTVQVRDCRTGAVVAAWQQPNGAGHVRWSPDGRTLAVAGGDIRRTYLYDRATWQPLPALTSGLGGELAFNRAGDRLVRSGWDGYVRLYDLGTGQPIFETTPLWPDTLRFGGEKGRLGAGIHHGRLLRCWDVGDGREVRLLGRADRPEDGGYRGAAVSSDARLLAVAMADGFGLWDLDSGRELAFVPLGLVGGVHFERSGSLLTATRFGLLRWPVRAAGDVPDCWTVGPPQCLLTVPSEETFSQSDDGQVTVVGCRAVGQRAPYAGIWLLHADRLSRPLHLDPGADINQVAVSPDGRWFVTGTLGTGPLKVWDGRDGSFVKLLGKWEAAQAHFSPDGRWLSTWASGGRLLAVGTWEPGPQVGEPGIFSPRGDLLAVPTDHGVVRLVEPATGRELARLDDPYGGAVGVACFTSDGSRLITLANNRVRGIRVWDLRLLRAGLRDLGLDWAGEEFPAAPAVPPIRGRPSVSVDLGYLHSPQTYPDAGQAVAAFSVSLGLQPLNPDAYLQRGLAFGRLKQSAQARDDYTRFLALAPADHPRRAEVLQRRANNHENLKDAASHETDLLALTRFDARTFPWPALLARQSNAAAWRLLLPRGEPSQSEKALSLARKAVELEPQNAEFNTTLGVAYFRLGRHQDAVAVLERNLEAKPHNPGVPWYVLAMCYHHLGQDARAKESFALAVARQEVDKSNLPERERADLQAFRLEAEDLLP